MMNKTKPPLLSQHPSSASKNCPPPTPQIALTPKAEMPLDPKRCLHAGACALKIQAITHSCNTNREGNENNDNNDNEDV